MTVRTRCKQSFGGLVLGSLDATRRELQMKIQNHVGSGIDPTQSHLFSLTTRYVFYAKPTHITGNYGDRNEKQILGSSFVKLTIIKYANLKQETNIEFTHT